MKVKKTTFFMAILVGFFPSSKLMFSKSLIALLGHSESLKSTSQELCLEMCQNQVLIGALLPFTCFYLLFIEIKFMYEVTCLDFTGEN